VRTSGVIDVITPDGKSIALRYIKSLCLEYLNSSINEYFMIFYWILNNILSYLAYENLNK